MVAVAVVIALWIPVVGWFMNPSSNAPEAQQAEQSATVESQAADEQAATEEAASEGESEAATESENESASADENKPEATKSESSQATAPAADLAWRDEDFAVDPAKQTEWNYEPNGRKVVYLTIDDGPSENTQAVLDILDRYNCKATFFVTGICPDYAHMIKEEYRRGHTVGMHTYSHDYAYVYSSQDAYFADLNQIAEVVREQIGYVPCFVRFPGGSSNGISADYCTGIMSALVNELPAAGYQYYDWNASTGDGSEHTADELYGYACEFDELENVVLLCHDSSTKQTTVEALPRIIEHYQDLGYTFEAIDRSSMVPHHGVSN